MSLANERPMTTRPATPSASFGDAVAEFRKTGWVIARGALPPAWVRAYRGLIAHWFDFLDRRVASGEKNAFLDSFSRQSGISLGLTADALSMPPPGARAFLGELVAGGLWNAGFFDEELGALIDACSVRRQKPNATDRALAYHQDSAVIDGADGLVFWIPLDAIDADTPGLEIVPNWSRPLPHSWNPTNSYLESTEPVMEQSVIVRMQLGDVLVFALPIPHRTVLTPGMTKTRFSIDLRAVPLSKIPPSYMGHIILQR